MEINTIIEKHKTIRQEIVDFIDDENADLQKFIIFLESQNLQQNRYEFELFLHLIAKISNNYHRIPQFFVKIEQIINFYKNYIQQNIPSSVISRIFSKNKRIILFLFNEQLITIEDLFEISHDFNYVNYFWPEINQFYIDFLQKKKTNIKREYLEIICQKFNDFYIDEIKKNLKEYPLFRAYSKSGVHKNSMIFLKVKAFLEDKIDLNNDYFLNYVLYNKNDPKLNFYEVEKKLVNDHLYEIFDNKFKSVYNIKEKCEKYDDDFLVKLSNELLKFEGNSDKIIELIFDTIENLFKRKDNEIRISCGKGWNMLFITNNEYEFIKEFTKELINETTNESANEFTSDFTSDCTNEFTNDFTNDCTNEFTSDFTNDCTNEFTNDFTSELKNEIIEDFANLCAKEFIRERIKEYLNSFTIESTKEFTNANVLFGVISYIKAITNNLDKRQALQAIVSKVPIFLNDLLDKELEKEYSNLFQALSTKFDSKTEDIELFNQNRKTGENDSYLCELIRNDSVVDFIVHINKTNLLTSRPIIGPSIFETNEFLENKKVTLIEYAAFYGSIEIFKYLLLNGVKLSPNLWLYAIHGRNPELIHLLEENRVEIYSKYECLYESIKCHHNEIATYLYDNIFIDEDSLFYSNLKYIDTNNYDFYPDSCGTYLAFSQFVHNDFTYLIEVLLKLTSIQDELKDDQNFMPIADVILNKNLELFQLLSPYITHLPEFAFINSKIKRISIPNSVKKISKGLCFDCKFLSDIHLSSCLIEIGDFSFYCCSSLTEIKIPSSVTKIGYLAFHLCESLKQIIIPSSVKMIEDYAFNRCKSLSNVSLPSSVTSIGKCSFRQCISLYQIEIPESVIEIGERAFFGCPFNEVVIPSSLKIIGSNAFSPHTLVIQFTFK